MNRNLLAIRHLEISELEELITLSREFKHRVVHQETLPSLGKIVLGLLFFENSTRTRVGFEQAAFYLGLKTVNFTSSSSSMNKGETLKDTILTLKNERLNGMVIRHKLSGTSALATEFFPGPVINAGDGRHEHPTQALGDALTILERKKRIEGLKVAIVGDVEHSRVARSNAWLLSKLGAEVRFVGPRTLIPKQMGMLPGSVHYDLATGLCDADVVMCLRLQRERMDEGLISSIGEYSKLYQVNRKSLRAAAPDCIVMHPGPMNRGVELDDEVADFDRSAILSQVENCIFARMAALYWCFGGQIRPPEATTKARSGKK